MATKIQWTDAVWNPVTGCTKVSPGCKHCYAEGVAERFWPTQYPRVEEDKETPPRGQIIVSRPRRFTDVQVHPDRLDQPLRWRKPRRVFVNSMSDLFHEDVPDRFIAEVFAVMAWAERHTFQVLTKRPERMARLVGSAEFETEVSAAMCSLCGMRDGRLCGFGNDDCQLEDPVWPLPNVWLGVSVEDQRRADERIPLLLDTPAAVRFVSAEPLLGPVDFSPWLYNPVDGSRGTDLRGGAQRRADDRRGGSGLAGSGPADGPLEREDEDHPLRAEAGGEPTAAGLPPGEGDDRGEAASRARASAGVAALQRTDPSGQDREPPQRGEGDESPVEPGAGDPGGADAPRPRGAGAARDAESERGAEPPREADRRAGGDDPGSKGSGRAAGLDRGRLRDRVPARVEDRETDRPQLSWVICGGESGPKARPMDLAWARSIVGQCREAGTACFVKQLGRRPVTRGLTGLGEPWATSDSHGGDMAEWPEDLRIREFPESRGFTAATAGVSDG